MIRRILLSFLTVVVLLAVVAPEFNPYTPQSRGYRSRDPRQFGDLRTVGKLFFVSGGKPHVCTATSVASPHNNLIATSAQCLMDRQTGKPVQRPVFIPYYQGRGRAPYGIYVVHMAFVHQLFFKGGGHSYAFATVYNGVPLDAAGLSQGEIKDLGRLGENVGGLGIQWNYKPASSYFAFGYPEGPHPDGTQTFSGDRIEWCHGRPRWVTVIKGSTEESELGIDCDFTPGGIGSPIVAEYDDGRRSGYLAGIVDGVADTDKDGRIDFVSFAYFDSSVAELYEAARKCWTPPINSRLTPERSSPCPGGVAFPLRNVDFP